MTTTLADVLAFLEADAALSALIGTRLYPLRLPQQPNVPCISYAVIASARFHAWTGPLELVRTRVQFDAWATNYSEVVAVADALRLRLDGYKGPAGAGEIQGAFFDSERDLFEQDAELYRRSMDYRIWMPEDVT